MRVSPSIVFLLAFGCAPSATTTGSIGAVLARDGPSGAVWAHQVPEGLSADDAGMRQGDRVKMIDGVYVDDLDRARIVRLLRGPVGSHVTVTVVRGDEVLQLSIVRQSQRAHVEDVPKTEKIE